MSEDDCLFAAAAKAASGAAGHALALDGVHRFSSTVRGGALSPRQRPHDRCSRPTSARRSSPTRPGSRSAASDEHPEQHRPRAPLRAPDVQGDQDARRRASSIARWRSAARRPTRRPGSTGPTTTRRSPRAATTSRRSSSFEADRMAQPGARREDLRAASSRWSKNERRMARRRLGRAARSTSCSTSSPSRRTPTAGRPSAGWRTSKASPSTTARASTGPTTRPTTRRWSSRARSTSRRRSTLSRATTGRSRRSRCRAARRPREPRPARGAPRVLARPIVAPQLVDRLSRAGAARATTLRRCRCLARRSSTATTRGSIAASSPTRSSRTEVDGCAHALRRARALRDLASRRARASIPTRIIARSCRTSSSELAAGLRERARQGAQRASSSASSTAGRRRGHRRGARPLRDQLRRFRVRLRRARAPSEGEHGRFQARCRRRSSRRPIARPWHRRTCGGE